MPEGSPASLTRFAPAPTGFLHMGHVVNAIYIWALARRAGARVLLRVEDHDAQRSRPEFEAALLDDLDWLGFVPDLFPTSSFRLGACLSRQRDREETYADVVARLAAQGLVYTCRCTRQELARSTGANAHGSPSSLVTIAERPYPGTCRARAETPQPGHPWRLRLDPEVVPFDDMLMGRQEQHPATQCGDVVIRDRRGNWTYQFAVAVDDFLQGIDLVVRGRDLLASTGRQIQLARLAGRDRPAVFAHHPLVMKTATQKLSKSDGDTGVRVLRASGWSAGRVIGEAAWRVGLQATSQPIPATDVSGLFRSGAPCQAATVLPCVTRNSS